MNTSGTSILIDEVRGYLNHGVAEVFDTMLGLEAKPAAVGSLQAPGQTLLAGSVRFDGDVSGDFRIQVAVGFADRLARQILGRTDAEPVDEEMVNDVIGELSNMIVAGVKSRLCDAGASCVLSVPTISRTDGSRAEHSGPSDRRLLTFRCGTDLILIEFLMKTTFLTWGI